MAYPLHVGFTGTQAGCTEPQLASLCALLIDLDARILHHGDCIGADAQAHDLARILGMRVELHPPDDGRKRAWCAMHEDEWVYPARYYLDRNADIVNSARILLACPSEETGESLRSGTWATVRAARRRGKHIAVIRPSGRVETHPGVVRSP
jgi:hypothetical protein